MVDYKDRIEHEAKYQLHGQLMLWRNRWGPFKLIKTHKRSFTNFMDEYLSSLITFLPAINQDTHLELHSIIINTLIELEIVYNHDEEYELLWLLAKLEDVIHEDLSVD